MTDRELHLTAFAFTGCPKKCVNITKSKLSALGLNFTMSMTWEGSTRLSLSKKRPEN